MSFRQSGFQFKPPAVFCSRDSTDGSSSRAVAPAVDENHRDFHQKTEGDVLLVRELNQLSMEERNRALEDVHGVGEIVKETPELVEESLELLETEINKVRSRTAYEKAAFMSPSYPKDRDFRLMFLRADFFNPKKAAKRLVSYFDHKLRLFGINKLVKPITLDDLDEEDLRDLHSGSLQVLPQKDRAGRTIIISFHEKHGYKTFENHVRYIHCDCGRLGFWLGDECRLTSFFSSSLILASNGLVHSHELAGRSRCTTSWISCSHV